MSQEEKEFVTIVMPALNEERYIAAAIATLLPDHPDFDYELLVLDGGSNDATQKIVQLLSTGNQRIRLINNQKRVQSAGVNLAAQLAHPQSEILIRADCHARYPSNFIEVCLREMRERECVSVVVPMETVGAGCVQKAIAAAQNSRLGNGGSKHRMAGSSGYVEHGHHAAFRRKAFLDVGGYNEAIAYNEDAELDLRLLASGGRIWLSGDATIIYFPRANLSALAKQYFRYGSGRANTWLLHNAPLRVRQLLPFILLLACITSVALSMVHPAFMIVPAAYAALCLIWGAALAIRDRSACITLAGLAAMTMHLSWGAGFLARIVQAAASKQGRRAPG
jgi:succinoglycan biosynthesis protein ExoA